MFKPTVGARRWQSWRIRDEAKIARYAPTERTPCRTSSDVPKGMPWELAGFVMRPPPRQVPIDAMPPMSPQEMVRALRRVRVPSRTLSKVTGYYEDQVRLVRLHNRPVTERMAKKLSPLIRKIEAGKVACIATGGNRWEFVHVVDSKVQSQGLPQGVHRGVSRSPLPQVSRAPHYVDSCGNLHRVEGAERGPCGEGPGVGLRHDGHAHAGSGKARQAATGARAAGAGNGSARLVNERANRERQARAPDAARRVRAG